MAALHLKAVEGLTMEYEFVIKKADAKTAKDRFIKQVTSKDTGKFAKQVYDTLFKLNTFKGPGTIAQLIESGMSTGWFTVHCDVCRSNCDKVVSFDVNGGEYEYDICADCLRGALIALARK